MSIREKMPTVEDSLQTQGDRACIRNSMDFIVARTQEAADSTRVPPCHPPQLSPFTCIPPPPAVALFLLSYHFPALTRAAYRTRVLCSSLRQRLTPAIVITHNPVKHSYNTDILPYSTGTFTYMSQRDRRMKY